MTSPSPAPAELPGNDEEIQRELLNATMQEALPLLQYVHNEHKAITFMPTEASGLPRKPTEILAFYMNRGDSPNLGVWEARQANETPVRIKAVPNARDRGVAVFEFTQRVKPSDGGPAKDQEVPLDTSFRYAHALVAAASHLQFQLAAEKAKAEMPRHARARAHVVGFFQRHGTA
jgi:hypothetical protein